MSISHSILCANYLVGKVPVRGNAAPSSETNFP